MRDRFLQCCSCSDDFGLVLVLFGEMSNVSREVGLEKKWEMELETFVEFIS